MSGKGWKKAGSITTHDGIRIVIFLNKAWRVHSFSLYGARAVSDERLAEIKERGAKLCDVYDQRLWASEKKPNNHEHSNR